MRSRHVSDASSSDVARRRLAALIAELEEVRGTAAEPRTPPAEVGDEDRATRVGRHARRPLPTTQRLGGWCEDRLPGALQGRAHLGSAQFGLVALVVAFGLVVGAWWLVRSAGTSAGAGEVAPPRPVIASVAPTTSLSPSPDAVAPASPTAEAVGAEGRIVVDVVGKVRHPGIVVLPAGARVVDAVRAAGGVRAGLDRVTVNMARPLTDGEQVIIGAPGPGIPQGTVTVPGAGPTDAPLVNLNLADQAELETLPGVGPVTAQAILQWREEHGAFTSVDELLEVSGIGDATLAEIAPHVTL